MSDEGGVVSWFTDTQHITASQMPGHITKPSATVASVPQAVAGKVAHVSSTEQDKMHERWSSKVSGSKSKTNAVKPSTKGEETEEHDVIIAGIRNTNETS